MSRFAIWLCFVICATALAQQPIAFSHKQHASTLKLKCNMCHANKDPGEIMGIAPASTCMQCHTAIKTDSPHIQKLADYVAKSRPIPWARVYAIPSYVAFSHRVHTSVGNTCQDCHGPVAEREVLVKESDISMTGCMNCHKAKNASNDCKTCHDER